MWFSRSTLIAYLLSAITLLMISIKSEAAEDTYSLVIENHIFTPAIIEIPANTKVRLVIYNKDNLAEEFDSFDLNREKVIFAGKKSTIFIGPLPVGDYSFFGEYHPVSAQGKIIVKERENVN